MATAWDVFNIWDREITLDAIHHAKGFRLLNCKRKNDKKAATWAIQQGPEILFFFTEIDCYNLRKRAVRIN